MHAVLDECPFSVTRSDIFGPSGGTPLPQPYADKIASLRALIGGLDSEIARLEERAAVMLAGDLGVLA